MEFGGALKDLGFNILASGGTAKMLADNGIPVTDVANIVGEPILGHRVVTLSREIHAALLATESDKDTAELARIGVPRIDLVYVNFYPLVEEIRKKEHTIQSVIEKTDIGGPTMLRSAAKGQRIVMHSPSQISSVLEEIQSRNFMGGGRVRKSFIAHLVAEAESLVSNYCAASANFHEEASRHLSFSEYD